jgi:hypothetical protein
MQPLIAFKQSGCFGHNRVEAGNHAESFKRVIKQTLTIFWGGFFAVKSKSGHGMIPHRKSERSATHIETRVAFEIE